MRIAIIGSGISGLYSCFLLERQYPKAHIDIYESSDRIGGRIQTIRPQKGVQFEAGAGRIANTHKLVWNLLNRYAASYKENKAEKEFKDNQSYPLHKHQKIILNVFNSCSKDTLQKMSFKELASQYTNIDVEAFIDAFGYSGKFELMDAYDACIAIRDELFNTYYAITSGLDTIPHGLANEIQSTIHYNTHISNITQQKKLIIRDKKTKKYDMIVIAVPIQMIRHFDVLSGCGTHTIGAKQLQRVYAQCTKLKLNKRYTMQSLLRYTIPINNTKNIHMVSYTDNNYTHSWNQVQDKDAMLHNEVKHHFNTSVKQSWWYSWDIGTSYWHPGKRNQFQQPQIKDVYIVGESVSDYQSWIEGALRSVEQTLKLSL